MRGKTTHGMSKTKQYKVWAAMHGRCRNPANKDFRHYGGRGISVCERWKSFERFIEDMGAHQGGLELDRIDNDGNYEPNNCRWVSHFEQVNNSRHNHFLKFEGKRLSLSQWALFLKLPASTIRWRVRQKLPLPTILSK